MLQTRKSRVIFVTPTSSYEINMKKDQLLAGMEIEEHIVADVVCSKDSSSNILQHRVSILWFYFILFSFILYCSRCSVTRISWPQTLHNDLSGAEHSCELIVKLQCHIFVDCLIRGELVLKGNSKLNRTNKQNNNKKFKVYMFTS